MTAHTTAERWRKSSYSNSNGDCVEVADGAASVGVRDSKNPRQAPLRVARDSWSRFARNTRDGGFDLS